MKRLISLTIAGSLIAATLTGCAQDQQWGNKETMGTVIGAGTGAAIGNLAGGRRQGVAWTLFGALAGGVIGNSIGKQLDRNDQMAMEKANYRAMEYGRSGQAETWYNPDSGHRGSVTPVRTWQQSDGRYCREFQQNVEIGGERQQAYGTACRQPDGTWKIVNG